MDYKRVGMQIGLAVFVAAASWTVGPNVAEAAPVKPIVSTASFKANPAGKMQFFSRICSFI
jgi:hypothetical protein